MVYCGASVSLCCLEVLVHTDADLIPDNLAWSYAKLPVDPEIFEETWDILNVDQTRAYGKYWIDSRRSLAVKVPSVVVPRTDSDFNILLNPTHEAFSEILWQQGGGFSFDPRLFKASG